MKKTFLLGVIALLSVSFIFMSCPQPADTPEPTTEEKAATALGEALGAGKATVSGATVTLTDNVTIASGTTISIPEGVKLVVPATKTFTLNASGNTVEGEIEVAGTYEVGAGVTGTNNGTVTVKSGGVIKNGAGVNIGGTGTNIVEAGGTVYFNGSATPYIGAANNENAPYRLSEGATFAFNNSGYTISGTVTLDVPGADGTRNVWVGNGIYLHIKAGGVLTIGDGQNKSQLNIVSSDDSEPIVTGEPAADGKAASQIVLLTQGKSYITFFKDGEEWSSDISGVPNVNFYGSTGTVEFPRGYWDRSDSCLFLALTRTSCLIEAA